MKKLLTITALLLAGLTTNAQGRWEVVHNEADPMKGEVERDVYIYSADNIGSVVVWDWSKADFRLITNNGLFNTWVSSGSVFAPVKVGFYNDNGDLEKMLTVNLVPETNSMKKRLVTSDFYIGGRSDIKKIMSRLKSGKGYVRIIASRYNESDFDIKITPFDKEKIPGIENTLSSEKAYRPSTSEEIMQVAPTTIQFYDGNEYSTPDDVMSAANDKTLKMTPLNQGDNFVVLGIEGQNFKLAKVRLSNGTIGWIYPPQVPNRLAFIPLLPFRDKFIPNIDTRTVAPGMTKEEAFIVTGSYASPDNKLSKVFGDYIYYQNKNDGYMHFYKNSLYFASPYNGGFWYRAYNKYRLVNVSRNTTTMEDSISSDVELQYRDNFMLISWSIQRNFVSFSIQNNAASSIKIIWDDMAFVGLDGKSKRIIHQGIKYDDKEKPQAPSVVMRNSKITDLLIPSSNIYYNQTLKKWSAHALFNDITFSPEDESIKHASGKKIQILLPAVVNETRYEYQFIFEIEETKFSLINFEYNQRTTDVLQ